MYSTHARRVQYNKKSWLCETIDSHSFKTQRWWEAAHQTHQDLQRGSMGLSSKGFIVPNAKLNVSSQYCKTF